MGNTYTHTCTVAIDHLPDTRTYIHKLLNTVRVVRTTTIADQRSMLNLVTFSFIKYCWRVESPPHCTTTTPMDVLMFNKGTRLTLCPPILWDKLSRVSTVYWLSNSNKYTYTSIHSFRSVSFFSPFSTMWHQTRFLSLSFSLHGISFLIGYAR